MALWHRSLESGARLTAIPHSERRESNRVVNSLWQFSFRCLRYQRSVRDASLGSRCSATSGFPNVITRESAEVNYDLLTACTRLTSGDMTPSAGPTVGIGRLSMRR